MNESGQKPDANETELARLRRAIQAWYDARCHHDCAACDALYAALRTAEPKGET